jgi:hypothetical protein
MNRLSIESLPVLYFTANTVDRTLLACYAYQTPILPMNLTQPSVY